MLHRYRVFTLGLVLTASVGVHSSLLAQDPPRPVEPRQDTTAPSPDRTGPLYNDANILALMDAASAAQIESSRLAEKQGASRDVKSIAERLIRDHTRMQQEIRELAKQLMITPSPPSPDPHAEDHVELMKELSEMSGTDFDRAFIGGQLKLHEKLLADLTKRFLPSVHSPELRAHLETATPTIQGHLDQLRTAKKQIAAL